MRKLYTLIFILILILLLCISLVIPNLNCSGVYDNSSGSVNQTGRGEVAGLPRLLDVGQCNDAYSAVRIATALADAFGTSVNGLPLSIILSWYEQKAVADLLALLSLGIKGMLLGPSLPAFITPNVLQFLVDNFNIRPIETAEEDLKRLLQARI